MKSFEKDGMEILIIKTLLQYSKTNQGIAANLDIYFVLKQINQNLINMQKLLIYIISYSFTF